MFLLINENINELLTEQKYARKTTDEKYEDQIVREWHTLNIACGKRVLCVIQPLEVRVCSSDSR